MKTIITSKEIKENPTYEVKVVFSLKKGDNGTLVKRLQLLLIDVLGPNALPRYGVDGIVGDETLYAIKSINSMVR